jgi:hypothetical protein
MFNFDKVKSVNISPSDKYIIWEENTENLAKDCDLNVSPGCVGLYIVNGVLKSVNTPGRWIINSRDEKRDKAKLTLIAVNSDKIFEIFCGTGNIPYHDYDIDIDATVGAHGDCKLRISNPWLLYTSFGHAPISAEEIDSFAKSKLIEIMSSQLAGAAGKYSYEDIKAKQSEISAELEKQFGKALIDIGLEVASFSLRGITFDQDYLDKRQWHFDNEKRIKEEKRARREKEREQRNEIENIVTLTNATKNNTPPAPAPAAPSAPNHTAQFCPQCGTKLIATAKFCSNCGKKLD